MENNKVKKALREVVDNVNVCGDLICERAVAFLFTKIFFIGAVTHSFRHKLLGNVLATLDIWSNLPATFTFDFRLNFKWQLRGLQSVIILFKTCYVSL